MKRIGDTFKGNQDWDKIAPDVMKRGVLAKFSENPDLATKLKSTGTKTFLECNPYDAFWGTGMSLTDTAALTDLKQIKGKNMLGKILSEIRKQLK